MQKSVFDSLHRKVEFNFPPKRIISTVPSLTELLADLDLRDELVALTRFCKDPEGIKTGKAIIGGTKRLDEKLISSLKPDLIIGVKEENIKTQVDEIAKSNPYYIANVENVKDNFEMIKTIGQLCDRSLQAEIICHRINITLDNLASQVSSKKKVAYLIWRNPMMVAGANTFIDSVLSHSGFENVFANFSKTSRYPIVSFDDIRQSEAEIVMLSSIPFPFKELHMQEFRLHLKDKKIVLVDGEVFSYYGSRLAKSLEYLLTLHK